MNLIDNKIVAIYTRLSREDSDNETSKSIENQINSLKDYIVENNMFLYKIYIDDGYTGSNFNRSDFQKMMNDLNQKKFNCIIVKDLSRFGRNLIKVGKYIDEIFPDKNIRFISVNDNYDSAIYDDDSIVIKNFLNDLCLRDTKKKIRASIKRRAQTKYMTSTVIYGYKRNEKGDIVIDPYAAGIVKRIFTELSNGSTLQSIADNLEKEKIYSPNFYKSKVLNKSFKNLNIKNPYRWSTGTISKISRNIEYLGHAKNLEYKKEKGISKISNDFKIVKNTHEPIISKDLFDLVQKNKVPRKKTSNLDEIRMKDIVKCGICNKNMVYRGNSSKYKNAVYLCVKCRNKIKTEVLHEILYNECIMVIKECKTDLETFKNIIIKKYNFNFNSSEYENLKKDIHKNNLYVKSLFEKKIEKLISEQEYHKKVHTIKHRIAIIKKKLKDYNNSKRYLKLLDYKINHYFNIKNLEFINKFEIIQLSIKEIHINNKGDKCIINTKFNFE